MARGLLISLTLSCSLTLSASEKPPNIVLITIDTLRADHLGMYGYPEQTSPFIDSLAGKGMVFDRASVPLPSTTPSHASIMTSLYPARHGSTSLAIPMSRRVDTIARALSRKNYYTAASVGVSHLGRNFNFDSGFADFSYPAAGIRDAATVNGDVMRFLDGHSKELSQRPFFVWLHYFDCHAPYGWWHVHSTTFSQPMETGPAEELIRRYDDSIRHTDEEVRLFCAYLSDHGLLENTIICIVADHGEQIGDHGLISGHVDIYRETVRVPLLFTGKGIPQGRDGRRVSTLDIGPSILNLAKATFESAVDGKNVLPATLLSPLLQRFFGNDVSNDTRDLLVTGNPSYTRSIELIHGRYWYIRNLDHLYRFVAVTPTAPSRTTDSRSHEMTPFRRSESLTTYTVPVTSETPFVATLAYTPPAGCEAEIVGVLPSHVTYFILPKKAWGPITIKVPASRLDILTIEVKPSSCAGTMSYSLKRLEAADQPAQWPGAVETHVFKSLYSPRKLNASDELYDIVDDPGMSRNLISVAGLQPVRQQMDRSLRRLYANVSGSPLAAHNKEVTVSREDLERLKSLGYLE